jgi:hypothetical protein
LCDFFDLNTAFSLIVVVRLFRFQCRHFVVHSFSFLRNGHYIYWPQDVTHGSALRIEDNKYNAHCARKKKNGRQSGDIESEKVEQQQLTKKQY